MTSLATPAQTPAATAPPRSATARLRIVLSRILATAFLIPALFARSRWEAYPLVEGLFFLTLRAHSARRWAVWSGS